MEDDSTFSGRAFYELYKGSEFLRNSENIETFLSKGYELRQRLKNDRQEYHVLKHIPLERKMPLIIKNTVGTKGTVENFEFTFNRLMGLVAAYAYENRNRFPIIKSSEAEALGLVWNFEDDRSCQLYLSAVSGTEHFPQFTFFPLVCALRKLQLQKMPMALVVKIASVKNDAGERMATVLMKNPTLTYELWSRFKGNPSKADIVKIISEAPPELKNLFKLQ